MASRIIWNTEDLKLTLTEETLMIGFYHLLTVYLIPFKCLQTFAGPLGQQSIFGWPYGLTINIWLSYWASNQYLDGPLGQPEIPCGQRTSMICCGLWPQLSGLSL